MIRAYIPGPTISYLIGLFGIGASMSNLPFALRIVIGIVSITILIATALIKFEQYLKARHERLMREETRGMRAFLNFMKQNPNVVEDIDQEDLNDLDDAHDVFLEQE